MQDEALVTTINAGLGIELPAVHSMDELHSSLAAHINFLIESDFPKLIFILYRIDVNEKRLTQMLQKNGGEGAQKIIASLIIERQLQKIKSRSEYGHTANNISEEEKW